MDLNDYLALELRDFFKTLPRRNNPVSSRPTPLIESEVQVTKDGDFKKELRKIGPMVGGANANTNSNAIAP